MDISFCDDCDASIPRSDLDRGIARQLGKRLLCAVCARKKQRGRSALLFLGPLALLAAIALGAATAVLVLSPRLQRAEQEVHAAKGRIAALEAADTAPASALRGLAEVDREQSRRIDAIGDAVYQQSAAANDLMEALSRWQDEFASEIIAIKDHLAATTSTESAPDEPSPLDVDELVALAVDPNPGARLSALVDLEAVTDPRVQGVLVAALADADAVVRAEAARILGGRAGVEAAGPLVDTLMDPDRRVRAVAHRALERILGVEVVFDPLADEEDRERAVEALRTTLSR